MFKGGDIVKHPMKDWYYLIITEEDGRNRIVHFYGGREYTDNSEEFAIGESSISGDHNIEDLKLAGHLDGAMLDAILTGRENELERTRRK